MLRCFKTWTYNHIEWKLLETIATDNFSDLLQMQNVYCGSVADLQAD
jgi:hypothetical protein